MALTLNSGAFLGEIWRGCIQAIPRGQWEAAEALGLPYRYKMRDLNSSINRPQRINALTEGYKSDLIHYRRSWRIFMHGPLTGVRVLELPAIGPVPFCGALLADLGADVVRIDRVVSADLGTPKDPEFDFYNRNKRSVALDLKSENAVDAVYRMLPKFDILMEGFRPGVAERLKLGPKDCMARNDRLIYGRLTGWGQSGPLAQTVGHDINYLALTGALHCIGERDGRPSAPLNLVADLGGGALYLAVGVLSAFIEMKVSGRGQVVEAAMVDGVANLMSLVWSFRQMGDWSLSRGDNIVDGGAPFYGTYETLDGKYVAVGAIESKFYEALVTTMGLNLDELPAQNDRESWPHVRQIFAQVFCTRTRDEWVTIMSHRDTCFAPVLDPQEALVHPQMRDRQTFEQLDGILHPAPAPRFERTPGTLRRRAPQPGEHSMEVLAELGLDADLIEALGCSGAMLQADVRG